MNGPHRSMFRAAAIKHYMEKNRGRDVLPRLFSAPTVIFLWILLGSLLLAGVFAWSTRIPIYATGSGVVLNAAQALKAYNGKYPIRTETGKVLNSGQPLRFDNSQPMAVIFLPTALSAKLQIGLPVQLHIGSFSSQLSGKIIQIDPGVTSPSAARERYGLDNASTLVITEPSVVVLVRLDKILSTDTYAGSILTANVQVGSQRVISLLSGAPN